MPPPLLTGLWLWVIYIHGRSVQGGEFTENQVPVKCMSSSQFFGRIPALSHFAKFNPGMWAHNKWFLVTRIDILWQEWIFSCEVTLWTARVCLSVFMSEGVHFLKWWKAPLPVHLETKIFVHSFIYVEICHSWRSKSSRLHSGIKNVLQDSLEDTLETQKESLLPVHIETWNFAHSFLM